MGPPRARNASGNSNECAGAVWCCFAGGLAKKGAGTLRTFLTREDYSAPVVCLTGVGLPE